jgi:hypothetical protein
VTIQAATTWYALRADEIRAMLDAHRPSPRKHRPSVEAVAAVGAYCAHRQRTRQRDPDAGDYFDDTIGQIADATKRTNGTVRDVLGVLGDAGWCVTIRKGGRGYGSRRRLTPPTESCGADPTPNAGESRGASPTPNAGESYGINADHRGMTADHRGDHRGAYPAPPLDPRSIQDQRDAPRTAAARASRVETNGSGRVTLGDEIGRVVANLDPAGELDLVRRNTDRIGRKPLPRQQQQIIDRNTQGSTP